MNNFKEAKPRRCTYYCWSQSLMHLRYPGSFLWRKEPGNIGGAEPFTSGTSSFMWFPLGTPHFGAIITQFLEGHVSTINSWPSRYHGCLLRCLVTTYWVCSY